MEEHSLESANLSCFMGYAARVRQISHTASIPACPMLQGMLALPNLSRVSMKGSGCEVASCWTTSKALRRLDIVVDRAINDRSQALHHRRETVTTFLHDVQCASEELQSLRFRGSLNDHLNQTLRAFTTLRSLILSTSNTLAPDTLAALAQFPHLERLALQAVHIQADTFREAVAGVEAPTFPSLRHLDITSHPELLAVLLEALPAGVLRSLHIHTAVAPASFQSVFARLAKIGATSFRELRFEYFLSRYDYLVSGGHPEACEITLDALRPLAGLRALRVLDVAGGAPPSFRDEDISELARWFPALAELSLGLVEDFHGAAPFSRVTPVALCALARGCRSLASLVLPLDVPEDAAAALAPAGASDFVSQTALRHLSIGDAPTSREGVHALMRCVLVAFPGVETVDSLAWGALTSLERLGAHAAASQPAEAPFDETISVGDASYAFVSFASG